MVTRIFSFIIALVFFISSFVTPSAEAFILPLGYKIPVVLNDGFGDPIIVSQTIRISLWARSTLIPQDINGSGVINTALPYYGSYQTTLTITPDGDGYFVPVTYGLYNVLPLDLPAFPATITADNLFLQFEYKNVGDPDTAYSVYDFGNSGGDISRYPIDESQLSVELNGGYGTGSTSFVLDTTDASTGNVVLQFGQILMESLAWNILNASFDLTGSVFVLDSDNTGPGVDVDIVANQGSDADGILRYNATLNQWELSNNGGGFVPLGGWHGSTARIKILPSDFQSSDLDDNLPISSTGTHISESGSADPTVNIPIPSGYKATHLLVYGSDTNNSVFVYANDISNGNTATVLGSGDVGSEIDITDLISTQTNYLSVSVNLGNNDELYGGYVTISPE